jgi:hypothetical protein
MPQVYLDLPGPHDAQALVLEGSRRFNVVDCGRRWGKSTLAVLRLTAPMLEGFPVANMCPTYKTLADQWRVFKNVLAPVTKSKLEQEHRIEIVTGGVLDMWSLKDPGAARGRKYKRVAIDEAAMVPGLRDAWEQDIRPTLSDYAGDADFYSTPKGHNYFWELYNRAMADPELWSFWQMPTVANPFILPSEIEAAQQELPAQVFSQEYLAEFIQHEGAVFRNTQACLNAPFDQVPEEHKGHHVVFGCDWAKQNDFTVTSLLCLDCKCEVALDRFNRIDYIFQRGRLSELWRAWSCHNGIVETNSIGAPIFEQLQRDGLPVSGFETTAISKPPLIENLALAFERAEYQWLNIPVATAELDAYECKVNPVTGRSTYSAPPGAHDDTVMARALALRAATRAGGASLVSF